MPTSVTGIWIDRRGRRATAGFTLVELLVVMFIIGLLVAVPLLSVSFGGRDQRLQQEGERLWQLMRLAAEEALLQGRQYGLRLTPTSYQFEERLEAAWVPLSEDRMRQRQLPGGIELEVEIEGIRIVLEEAGERPQVFFLSSGEVIPDFSLRLVDRDAETAWRIEPGATEAFQLQAEPL